MTLKTKVASALSFAHMAGLGRGKAAKATEDDEEKKKEDAKRAEDESDDEEASAESEDQDDKKDDDKDAKKAKSKADAEDGDEQAEDDEDEDKKSRASARNERARCKAIVAHGVKTDQVMHACAYAFDTNMSADAAIATLDANLSVQGAKPRGASLAERMASVNTPVVQPEREGPDANTAAGVAAQIIAAAAKASGQKA